MKIHFVKERPDALWGLRIACDVYYRAASFGGGQDGYPTLPSTTDVFKVTCGKCKRMKIYKEAVLDSKYPLFQYLKP